MSKGSNRELNTIWATTLVLVAAVVLASACSSDQRQPPPSTTAPAESITETPAPGASDVPALQEPTPTTEVPTEVTPLMPEVHPEEPSIPPDRSLPNVGPEDRLIVDKIDIDAPLSLKVVGADARLPDPDGPDDVAYYNFSAWPGYGGAPGIGGNAVFSGHVDSGVAPCKAGTVPPPCTAVFWDLNRLAIGDEIMLRVGGISYVYAVTSNEAYPEGTNWAPIFAATADETLTLVTCGGDFNPQSRSYDMRQVVKANRIAP